MAASDGDIFNINGNNNLKYFACEIILQFDGIDIRFLI